MTDFTGQKALVTGATRGIGRAIALAFLERGATVIGLYGGDKAAAKRFRDECRVAPERLHLFCCDVSDY